MFIIIIIKEQLYVINFPKQIDVVELMSNCISIHIFYKSHIYDIHLSALISKWIKDNLLRMYVYVLLQMNVV